jgi:hypothetical protein
MSSDLEDRMMKIEVFNNTAVRTCRIDDVEYV